MRAILAALALAAALCVSSRNASAESVGLVVVGDAMTKPAHDVAGTWLTTHGQQVETTPLPSDAIKTLQDCFLTDDPKCSQSVIDARATTSSVVSVRVELTDKKTTDVRVTIDWFDKGRAAVTARRTCEACKPETLGTTIDGMMQELSRSKPGIIGHIKVSSTPAGMTVLVDGATAGVTPLDQDIAVGEHKLRLAQDGRMGPEKSITVPANAPAPIDVTLENPPPATGHTSRVIPGVMIGLGVAGIGAGAALYFTSQEPTGTNRTYRDTKTLGIAVGAAGAAVAITGVIIILATGHDSGPTMTTTAGGATIGWIGRF